MFILKLIKYQTVRYFFNGVIATSAHYLSLLSCLELFNIQSAGLANFFSSIIGITFSFFGNRYFVFKSTHASILNQIQKFLPLYYCLSITQGGILYLWTDIYNLNYNFGFCICILFQVIVGYLGGKFFVFNEQ